MMHPRLGSEMQKCISVAGDDRGGEGAVRKQGETGKEASASGRRWSLGQHRQHHWRKCLIFTLYTTASDSIVLVNVIVLS